MWVGGGATQSFNRVVEIRFQRSLSAYVARAGVSISQPIHLGFQPYIFSDWRFQIHPSIQIPFHQTPKTRKSDDWRSHSTRPVWDTRTGAKGPLSQVQVLVFE